MRVSREYIVRRSSSDKVATLPGFDHAINRGGDGENARKQTNGIEINARKHRDNRRISGDKTDLRQRKLLESKVEDCHELKTELPELKLERGVVEEDMKARSVEIEKRLTEYEKLVGGLEDLEKQEKPAQGKEEQSKWEIKKKFEAKADGKEGDGGKPKAKLPKVVIRRFTGDAFRLAKVLGAV